MKSIIYPIIVALTLLGSSGCIQTGQFGLRGQGPVVERKVTLDPIKGISLPGCAKIYLTQGTRQEVRISGQENIIDNLNLEVRGEIWQIDNKRSVWQSETVKIFITLENLRLLKISGSGTIEFLNHFTDQKDLEVRISGSGKMDLDLDAREIDANISGSGDLFMKGTADDLNFSITGSGSVNAYDLTSQKARVRISGSGGMKLTVEDRLDAHISGSGSVLYKGNPRVDSSVTGSGSVRSY